MLNRTKEEAETFIRENSKAFGGKMTQKEIGLVLGVSGPRVNQMIAGMIPVGQPTTVESVETALAPEAA